ncbi:hypothetical protein Tco_0882834, partial [Tanacetum coccineum]
MTPATISSGLVPNPTPSTPFIPPSRSNWDLLFQPLFDELLTPPPSVDHPAPEVIALIDEVVAPVSTVSTGSPSLTTVDQDAPSPSNSQTTPETESPIIPNDFKEDNHDLDVLRYHILEMVNCVLRISELYTSRLLDAACKKVMNLLKKGLLKVEAMPKSGCTEKDQIDNFLNGRRLMRSLDKFVGGRLYEGDLR